MLASIIGIANWPAPPSDAKKMSIKKMQRHKERNFTLANSECSSLAASQHRDENF